MLSETFSVLPELDQFEYLQGEGILLRLPFSSHGENSRLLSRENDRPGIFFQRSR